MALGKDFVTGLIFLLIGIGVVVEAQTYAIGSVLRMGPGYFPTVVGALTCLVGAAVIGKSLLTGRDSGTTIALRPLVMISIAILVFALALEPLGLVLSTLALVVLARLGSSPLDVRQTAILSIVLVVMASVVFRYLLNMPLSLWP